MIIRDSVLYSSGAMMVGFSDAATDRAYGASIYRLAEELHAYIGISGNSLDMSFGLLSGPVGSPCTLAIVLRSSGAFAYQLVSGAWLLMAEQELGNASPLYPTVANNNQFSTIGALMVGDLNWVMAPTVSDSFDRADISSTMGSSDGLGTIEGVGGSGLAWTASVGTWGIATNRGYCSALAGGIGIATQDAGASDVYFRSNVYRSAGTAGLVVRYVDANNYIYALLDGTGLSLRKKIAGVDSEVVAPVAATPQNGHYSLAVRAIGTGLTVYYKNAFVLQGTISDAALQTGSRVGLYVSNIGNLFSGACAAFPVGTDGKYNSYFAKFVPTRSVHSFVAVGDSKTEAAYRYPGWMSSDTVQFVEASARIGHAGETTADVKGHIDADLAAATGTPEYITYNLGANDQVSENSFKTDSLYILDAIHVKWPSAQIYMARVWQRGSAFNDTLAGWVGDVVALRSTFAHLGPDERIYIQMADDGAYMTTDGIHPNIYGTVESARQWRTVLGY